MKNRYLYADAIDSALAEDDFAGGAATSVDWLLTDHQGSVRDVVTPTGVKETHIEYDSFGNILAITGTVTTAPRVTYTGYEFDSEIGLYYSHFRYYDATTGRWISVDPLGYAAGDVNLYRYVNNSPVIYVDPTGLIIANAVQTFGSWAANSLGGLFQSASNQASAFANIASSTWSTVNSNAQWSYDTFGSLNPGRHFSGGADPIQWMMGGASPMNVSLPGVNLGAFDATAASMPVPSLEELLEQRELDSYIRQTTNELNEGWQWNQVSNNLAAVGQLYEGVFDVTMGVGATILSGGGGGVLGGGALTAIGLDKMYAAVDQLHNGVSRPTYWEQFAHDASGGNEYLAMAMIVGVDIATPGPKAPTRFIDGVKVVDRRTGNVLQGTVDLHPTLERIKQGSSYPHRNDGGVFQNRPQPGSSSPALPAQSDPGYYTEYVHPTPGVNGPGPQRIVTGKSGEIYYTPDHYSTFIRVDEAR